MNLDELNSRARTRRRELDRKAGEARSVLTAGKALATEVGELETTISTLDKVTGLLNTLGEDRQQKAQTIIENLVTRGLQTIFDDTLSFHIVQSVKAKSAAVEFLIRTTLPGNVVETPVMDARGGGLAATVGFLLRVVVMLLAKGGKQNLMVLDETFAHVSADYLPNVAEFLREIVDKTGVQIVLVTHQSEFEEYADRVYRFTTKDGKTIVSENG